jgi:hypothetical protein
MFQMLGSRDIICVYKERYVYKLTELKKTVLFRYKKLRTLPTRRIFRFLSNKILYIPLQSMNV